MRIAQIFSWLSVAAAANAIPASKLAIVERASKNNRIQNFGFETGDLASWVRAEVQNPKSKINVSSPGIQSTEYAAYLTPPQPESQQIASVVAALQQDVSLVTGKKYTLYYSFAVTESVPSEAQAYYVNPNGTLTELTSWKQDRPKTFDKHLSYSVESFKFTAPTDSGTLMFLFATYPPYSRKQTFIFDNVYFQRSSLSNPQA